MFAILAVWTSLAHAAPQANQTRYCAIPFDVLRANDPAKLVSGIQIKCQPGDIVQFPSSYTYAMSKVCDFSRSIIVTETIACVYAGERGER